MKLPLLVVIFLTATQASLAGAQGATTNRGQSSPDVVISEVVYWSAPGQKEWVELTNFSNAPVDIAGWRLRDGSAIDFEISKEALVIPPQNSLIVLFDGTGRKPSPFDHGRTTAFSPRGLDGDVLKDTGGQIALYCNVGNRYEREVVKGFVAWGRSPGRVINDAMRDGVWSPWGSRSDEVVLGTRPELYTAPVIGMKQGSSIGIVEPLEKAGSVRDKWAVLPPKEVNPGEVKMKREIVLARPLQDGKTGIGGTITLSVVPMGIGTKYHFQVATDKEFKHIYDDQIEDYVAHAPAEPIPSHQTHYWRARLIYSDGTPSSWSEVRSLTNPYGDVTSR